MKRNLILVVDDHRDARRMLGEALKTLDSENDVVEVPSGEEALLVNTCQSVDLLILDVNLPGISGLEVVEKVRHRNPASKIILITGSTETGLRKKVDEAGVEGVFYKPISITPFLETVNRCLGLSGGQAKTPVSTEKGSGKKSGIEKQAVEEAPLPALSTAATKIEDLLKEVNAKAVVVVDHTGRRVLQTGTLSLVSEDLVGAALGMLQACMRAGRALEDELPEIIYCLMGYKYMLYLAPIIDGKFLLVVAEFVLHDRFSHQGIKILNRIPEIRSAFNRESKSKIQEPEVEPQPASEIVIPDEAINPEELAALEAFFNQAETKPSQGQDLDEFWEALAQQNGDNPTAPDGMLTYDQAREMGIAPE